MTRRAVLLHGFTGSAGSWGDDHLATVRGAGYEPVAVDLPGHGARAVGGADPTLESALEIVDAALGDQPGAVLGYSMGGRIALHYAARHPDRVERLVLESASPGLRSEATREPRRVADEALAARIAFDGIERFTDFWEALPLFATQRRMPHSVQQAVRQRRLRNDPAALGAALRGLGQGVLPSLWDELAALDLPVLVIAGAQDPKYVAIGREMSDALPKASLVIVPRVSHAVHLEEPKAWGEAVAAFLTA